ncbi:hypothetical protein GCM10007067_09300 [Lysobacter bugurensis]|uniref:Uncharacterized protein n=1 Tax=Cognatilysobacter bugurensis TaxID=543356 RepID=A0A918SVW4_9GAMM|nr:hypothetical protein [Lysobacter bugurensis]GHA74451.1 hypothetical protein GCM10007067_09300 [Lysobacter bugurensis]
MRLLGARSIHAGCGLLNSGTPRSPDAGLSHWRIPASKITDEAMYCRRRLLRALAANPALALARVAVLSLLVGDEFLTRAGAPGADPGAAIEPYLGLWALRFLLLTLAMSLLRRLIGQPWPLRFRRMLGLYPFADAALHSAA